MAEISYKAFKEMYLGKSVDVDGFPIYNIYQCWDLVSGVYFKYIGGKTIHCEQSEYVIDIANQKETNGILNFCDEIALDKPMQPGDICIWTQCPACPWSHIAIYDRDNGQNEVYFLGQNQPYNYVNVKKISTKGIVAVFRPKKFVQKKVTPMKKTDQKLTVGSVCRSEGFYVKGLRVRNKQWEMYNDWVGGWIPTAHVHEVDARDGKMDNILHIGSGVAFDGTLTVTKVNVKSDTVYIKELGYFVKARCLYELKDGR